MDILSYIHTKNGSTAYAIFKSKKLHTTGLLVPDGKSSLDKLSSLAGKYKRTIKRHPIKSVVSVCHPNSKPQKNRTTAYQKYVQSLKNISWDIVGSHQCYTKIGFPYRNNRKLVNQVNHHHRLNLSELDYLVAHAISLGAWFIKSNGNNPLRCNISFATLNQFCYHKIRTD